MRNRCVMPNCDRLLIGPGIVCETCLARTRAQLAELPKLHAEAGDFLEPGRSGSGSGSSEQNIGVSVAALSFRQAGEIIRTLTGWARVVLEDTDRIDREDDVDLILTGSVEKKIQTLVTFLLKNHPWLEKQLWVDEYMREVAELYGQGNAATRQLAAKIHGLKCPTTFDDGELCGAWLPLVSGRKTKDGEDIQADVLDIVECRRCSGQWTVGRLILVALNTPKNPIWLDAEAISEWVGITPGQVRRQAEDAEIPWRGSRPRQYELAAFIEHRERKGA